MATIYISNLRGFTSQRSVHSNVTLCAVQYNRKTPEHAPEPTYVNSGISISG